MVQVLPYIPSFLEKLTPYIKQATGEVANSLEQRAAMKGLNSLLNPPQQAAPGEPQQPNQGQVSPLENMSPINAVKTFKMAEKALGPEGAKVLIDNLMQSQKIKDKEAAEIRAEQRKEAAGKREKRERADRLISNIKKMEALLPYTGSTIVPGKSFNAIPGGLNREGLQKRNTFNTLAAEAASFFRDLETKGTLPQGLYEKVIEPRLPNADLSERENKGRIEGILELAKEYGGYESEAPKETVAPKAEMPKVKPGTKLTKEVAEAFKKEGLTREEAEKRAKELGYEF